MQENVLIPSLVGWYNRVIEVDVLADIVKEVNEELDDEDDVRHADGLARPPLMAGAMAALMLFNVLVFRQAEWLSAAMSWHIFHVLVALWLVGLGVLLAPKPAQS